VDVPWLSGFRTVTGPQLQTSAVNFRLASPSSCSSLTVSLIFPRHGPRRKHRLRGSSVMVSSLVAAGTMYCASRWLAMDVFTEPFPSNGCLCWFYNSGFQQTCHNMYKVSRNSCSNKFQNEPLSILCRTPGVVYEYMEIQFVSHRKRIACPLQSPTG
jgi:superfamily II DNA helicase RecQ